MLKTHPSTGYLRVPSCLLLMGRLMVRPASSSYSNTWNLVLIYGHVFCQFVLQTMFDIVPFHLQDGGKSLQEGLEENSTLTQMDLRLTEVGQECEYCINQLIKANMNHEYFHRK